MHQTAGFLWLIAIISDGLFGKGSRTRAAGLIDAFFHPGILGIHLSQTEKDFLCAGKEAFCDQGLQDTDFFLYAFCLWGADAACRPIP